MSAETIPVHEVLTGLSEDQARMVKAYLDTQNADDKQLFFESVSVKPLENGWLVIDGVPSRIASPDLARKSIFDAVAAARLLA